MDAEQIREELRRRYASVAERPEGQFSYPTGRASAKQLGYPRHLIDQIPKDVTDRFVGVGNPFSLGDPGRGWRVVDVGSGGGFDAQVAAHFVEEAGQVIGVDMSPELLARARAGVAEAGLYNVTFVQGRAEELPVESGWADLILSNGVLNLATCKESAFAEIARVLRKGGRFQAADLVLVKDLPEDLRQSEFAWSN